METNTTPALLQLPDADPEIVAMLARIEARAKLWTDVEAAGVTIRRTSTEVVVGNAYRIRKALAAHGFQWDAQSKTWRFWTTQYYNIRMRAGRLDDGMIRRRMEPLTWIVDAHTELFGR